MAVSGRAVRLQSARAGVCSRPGVWQPACSLVLWAEFACSTAAAGADARVCVRALLCCCRWCMVTSSQRTCWCPAMGSSRSVTLAAAGAGRAHAVTVLGRDLLACNLWQHGMCRAPQFAGWAWWLCFPPLQVRNAQGSLALAIQEQHTSAAALVRMCLCWCCLVLLCPAGWLTAAAARRSSQAPLPSQPLSWSAAMQQTLLRQTCGRWERASSASSTAACPSRVAVCWTFSRCVRVCVSVPVCLCVVGRLLCVAGPPCCAKSSARLLSCVWRCKCVDAGWRC